MKKFNICFELLLALLVISSWSLTPSEVPPEYQVEHCSQYEIQTLNHIGQTYVCTNCRAFHNYSLSPVLERSASNHSEIRSICMRSNLTQDGCQLYEKLKNMKRSEASKDPRYGNEALLLRSCVKADMSKGRFVQVYPKNFVDALVVTGKPQSFYTVDYNMRQDDPLIVYRKNEDAIDSNGQINLCFKFEVNAAPIDETTQAQNHVFDLSDDLSFCRDCNNRHVQFDQNANDSGEGNANNHCYRCKESDRNPSQSCCHNGLLSKTVPYNHTQVNYCVEIPYCLEIDEEDSCITCTLGFNPTTNCTQCLDGFRLVQADNQLSCVSTVENCAEYNADTECIRCQANYELTVPVAEENQNADEQDNLREQEETVETTSLDPHCQNCDQNSFRSKLDASNCLPKIADCQEYNDLDLCSKCDSSVSLESKTTPGTCFKITEGCVSYDDADKCQKCEENKRLSNQIPHSCLGKVSWCAQYDQEDNCKSCNLGFAEVDAEGKCSQCADNYRKTSNETGECVPELAQCEEYESDENCTKCANGFELSSQTGKCDSCSSGYSEGLHQNSQFFCYQTIKNCETHSHQGCTECSDDFQLADGKCQHCKGPNDRISNLDDSKCIEQVSNCVSYNDDDSCAQCSAGFRVSDKSPLACAPKTKFCGEDSYINDICSECVPGHKLSEDGECDDCESGYQKSMVSNSDSCVKKLPDCLEQLSDTECLECVQGHENTDGQCDTCSSSYISVRNQTDLTCVKMTYNCKSYDEMGCSQCINEEEYILDAFRQCHKKDQHCQQYQGSTCIQCCPRYVVWSSYPLKCHPQPVEGCLEYIGNPYPPEITYDNLCKTCKSGFHPTKNNNRCLKDIQHCFEYDQSAEECCGRCDDGYYLNNQQSECLPNPECPQSDETCKYVVITGGQCAPVPLQCSEYAVKSGRCLSCNSGHHITSYSTCVQDVALCVKHHEQYCQKCEPGYFVSTNGLQCIIPTCEEENKCNTHSPNFTYQLFENGECHLVPLECEIWHMRGRRAVCLRCKTGLNSSHPSSGGDYCLADIEGCKVYDNDSCYECEDGLYLNYEMNQCKPVEQCDLNELAALPEREGIKYVKINGTCSCVAEKCASYLYSGSCDRCEDGWHLDDHSCWPDVENCQRHRDEYCVSCEQGYSLASDRLRCIPNVECPQNTDEYIWKIRGSDCLKIDVQCENGHWEEDGSCYLCKIGFQKDGAGGCEPKL